jgi:hypothetical protein
LWCGKDQKQVIVVKEGQEPAVSSTKSAMDKLEGTLIAKVEALQTKIEKTDDVEELGKLTNALSELLNSLEKIKRMKKS